MKRWLKAQHPLLSTLVDLAGCLIVGVLLFYFVRMFGISLLEIADFINGTGE